MVVAAFAAAWTGHTTRYFFAAKVNNTCCSRQALRLLFFLTGECHFCWEFPVIIFEYEQGVIAPCGAQNKTRQQCFSVSNMHGVNGPGMMGWIK